MPEPPSAAQERAELGPGGGRRRGSQASRSESGASLPRRQEPVSAATAPFR